MSRTLAAKWDAIYSRSAATPAAPVAVLSDNAWLLPKTGTALDLACGLGGNAQFLAAAGLAVLAFDISAVAIARLQRNASRQGLNISARQQFIDAQCLAGRRFDVIVISRFLDRALGNAIIHSLKPDGLLFYQTFTRTKVSDRGPENPDFLLKPQELLQLFAPLRVIYYRDNAYIGDVEAGLRNEAQFIGQKCNDTTQSP
ncbi:MAG: SAM-dependent methyltransferase [Gammaproteobacteria bacterium HGW-Gammaproteobacteria-3]|nr:MAG: SAM-dependent methyltransferase [Gammaproteobacteria bacterium HGW-Gammaproteobacteria-3]